jgi:Zn-dependent protease with chaperone function
VIYNNLLYFLVVILVFSTSSIPASPQIPPSVALPIFVFKALLFQFWVRKKLGRRSTVTDNTYFALEQKFTVVAIVLYIIDLYLLDAKYYLALLPLMGILPILMRTAGLALFFFYLCLLWATARRSYHHAFKLPPESYYTTTGFLLYNIKNNLPIVLPWLLITFLFDLFQLIPLPFLERLHLSQWGEPLAFLLFFIFLATTFPALVKWLWNCKPLPQGPVRSHIENFCRQQGFITEILLWPLFEGRVLTAGVMGISKRLRYLLITPALINALNPLELEAVLAHEIGHVKKYHLQLYLVLFLGFGLLLSLIANPLLYLLLNTQFFYKLVHFTTDDIGAGMAFWGTAPLFIIMIVYFRYIFSFFMRNFERQADLHVFQTIGDSRYLVSSFEKIGILTGKRDMPSWHHFGIGQRIDFLEKCEKNPGLIKRHNRKVFLSLLLYVLILGGSAAILQAMPTDLYSSSMERQFVEAVLTQRIRQEPDNPLWHRLLGDLYLEKEEDAKALTAYSNALALEPSNPEIMNNYAWLLLTTKVPDLRDPLKALSLAASAAARYPTGYILDTLAMAYWATGEVNKAVDTEKQAIRHDPDNRQYYQRQIIKFSTEQYE